MRLIDADELLKGKEDHQLISTHLIWNAPTVDAVPVVRCKDCKHSNTDECSMYYEEWIEYDEGDGFIERDFISQDRTVDDGFCFNGERREE